MSLQHVPVCLSVVQVKQHGFGLGCIEQVVYASPAGVLQVVILPLVAHASK